MAARRRNAKLCRGVLRGCITRVCGGVSRVLGDGYAVLLAGVRLAGGPLDERLAATGGRAEERLLAGVQAAVVVERVALGELALTVLAGVLLGAGVHVAVVLEGSQAVEALAALVAHVRLLASRVVGGGVQAKLVPVVEPHGAVFEGAPELFARLWMVHLGLVLLGQPLRGEALGTVGADDGGAADTVVPPHVDLQKVLRLELIVAVVAEEGALIDRPDRVVVRLLLLAAVQPPVLEVERGQRDEFETAGAVGVAGAPVVHLDVGQVGLLLDRLQQPYPLRLPYHDRLQLHLVLWVG